MASLKGNFSVYKSDILSTTSVVMAEEEVSYASVVFKTNNHSPPEAKKEEETVYDEVKVQSETTKQPAVTNVSAGFLPDKKANNRRRHYRQLACCLGIFCVFLLLGIIAACVYIAILSHESDVTELNQLKDKQTTLLDVIRNLTDLGDKLSSKNQNLRRVLSNLTDQSDNLTQGIAVLETNIANLTAEKLNLTALNSQLSARNQELETQKNNLTEQIQNMASQRNELNIARVQWSINAYCPRKDNERKCNPCQEGWLNSHSNCYAINDPQPPNGKTWEEARENCRGKESDLAVIDDEVEKTFISEKSWGSSGFNGYWIGLRVEDGKWKWVNGSDLTNNSWIQTPTAGQCAISVQNEGWKSVSCGNLNRWICRQKAVSV